MKIFHFVKWIAMAWKKGQFQSMYYASISAEVDCSAPIRTYHSFLNIALANKTTNITKRHH